MQKVQMKTTNPFFRLVACICLLTFIAPSFLVCANSLDGYFPDDSWSRSFIDGSSSDNYLNGTSSLDYLNGSYVSKDFLDAGDIAEKYLDAVYISKALDGNREDFVLDLDGTSIPFSKIIGKVVIGEAVMFVTAIVCSSMPGTQPFVAIIISMHVEALKSAAIEAAISGVFSCIETQGDVSKMAGKVLEGAADGYMWGAIFAAGEEAVKTAKIVNKAKHTEQSVASKATDATVAKQVGKKAIQKASKKSVEKIGNKIAKSAIRQQSKKMLELPAIRLTTKTLDAIRQNPELLKQIVKDYTGKSFADGYLEFFLRLAKQHPKQVETIWNSSQAVRNIIKNAGIRAGGVHEWLMCENFCDFILFWGREDGAYLANLLPKLTTATEKVYMENIVAVKNGEKQFFKIWTHEMETFGKGPIHDRIREVVEASYKVSHNPAELLANLDVMIKENFSEETYKEFSKALEECLK